MKSTLENIYIDNASKREKFNLLQLCFGTYKLDKLNNSELINYKDISRSY